MLTRTRFTWLCLGVAQAALAATIRVPADQPTIQAGIDAAAEFDLVLVAPGTYAGDGNKNIDFRGVNRTLLSEEGATRTVIDCGGHGRGFFFHSGENHASFVGGFTITNGQAVNGGAIKVSQWSSPTVMNCIISGNRADLTGGGIQCLYLSSPHIINCLIIANSAGFDGGGLQSVACWLRLENCTISGNDAGNEGGGIYIDPGGLVPTMMNCIFWDNTPNEIGSDPFNPAEPELTYCDVRGGYEGIGNIDRDPEFRSMGRYLFLLGSQSSCIDAGTFLFEDGISDWHPRWPDWYPNAPRSDMGAYGGPGNVGWVR